MRKDSNKSADQGKVKKVTTRKRNVSCAKKPDNHLWAFRIVAIRGGKEGLKLRAEAEMSTAAGIRPIPKALPEHLKSNAPREKREKKSAA